MKLHPNAQRKLTAKNLERTERDLARCLNRLDRTMKESGHDKDLMELRGHLNKALTWFLTREAY